MSTPATGGQVVSLLAAWIRLLTTIVQANPRGDIYDILARRDLTRQLEDALGAGLEYVDAALGEAWPLEASNYREQLAGDVSRAYAEAEAALRDAAVEAFQGVPRQPYQVGVHPPGRNPDAEAAERRAEQVRLALAAAARWLAFRNEMTVDVARTRHRNEQILKTGEERNRRGGHWLKKWVCRKGPDGRPDRRVCEWCRELDRMAAIPLDQEFSYGTTRGQRQPPRVYRDLQVPPRHPRCRCRIVLVRAGASAGEDASRADMVEAPAHISADWVRSLPEERYKVLDAFQGEAAAELGQILQQLAQAKGQGGGG